MAKIKRMIYPILMLLTLTVVLSACGSSYVRVKGSGSPSSLPVLSSEASSSDSTADKPLCGSSHRNYSSIHGYDIPDELKGTTVRYATWVDHTVTEGAVPLANFEPDTGIKVELMNIPESGYTDAIISKVASGNAPDVFVTSDTNPFPLTLQIAAPINKVSTVCVCEPLWNTFVLEEFTIDDNIYLVDTIGSPYARTKILFYNKVVFEENGFKTPAEYYNEGNLTWNNLIKCLKDIKSLGPEFHGGYFTLEDMVLSADAGLVRYDHSTHTFSKNSKCFEQMSEALTLYNDIKAQGLLTGSKASFQTNRCGIYITDAYGLKNTGYFMNMNPEDVGFTYLPSFETNEHGYITTQMNLHGIVDGALNADAAGYFIRYWLDPNNYDLKNTFLTNAAGNFYYELTNETKYKNFDFERAAASVLEKSSSYSFHSEVKSGADYLDEASTLNKSIDIAVADMNKLLQDKVAADRLKYGG